MMELYETDQENSRQRLAGLLEDARSERDDTKISFVIDAFHECVALNAFRDVYDLSLEGQLLFNELADPLNRLTHQGRKMSMSAVMH